MNNDNHVDNEYFIGIDPSLTATGLVMINEIGESVIEKLIKTNPKDYLCSEQRLLDILDSIKFITGIIKPKTVYIEALSYMSSSTSLFERCGLLYLMTTFLFENEIPYKTIPPTSLKKWAVGKGNADKKMMMNISGERWGIDFKDDNICDAYNLAQLCREKEFNNGK